ncbi:MAG: hypothetical protein ACJASQ_002739 [Crocinitomicaceae bacterium]|jgi:hypothetical protein
MLGLNDPGGNSRSLWVILFCRGLASSCNEFLPLGHKGTIYYMNDKN